MSKMKMGHPHSNLGDYLHPTKSKKPNAPMAKPMQPLKQRVLATPMAPIRMHPKKMTNGKKGNR